MSLHYFNAELLYFKGTECHIIPHVPIKISTSCNNSSQDDYCLNNLLMLGYFHGGV
jgi:hypothetical protein